MKRLALGHLITIAIVLAFGLGLSALETVIGSGVGVRTLKALVILDASAFLFGALGSLLIACLDEFTEQFGYTGAGVLALLLCSQTSIQFVHHFYVFVYGIAVYWAIRTTLYRTGRNATSV